MIRPQRRFAPALAATALLGVGSMALALCALTPPAYAQSAAKATVDAAKAAGQVGEQADGFLGLVSGGDAAVRGAVAEINAGRAQAFRDAAARTGVSADAAGQAAALQLFSRLPSGAYYKPAGGSWERK